MVCGLFDLRQVMMGTSCWNMDLGDFRLQMQFGIQREQEFNSHNMSATDHVVGSLSLEVAIKCGFWEVEIMPFMQKTPYATLMGCQTS